MDCIELLNELRIKLNPKDSTEPSTEENLDKMEIVFLADLIPDLSPRNSAKYEQIELTGIVSKQHNGDAVLSVNLPNTSGLLILSLGINLDNVKTLSSPILED